jgi:hypothetical protein
MGWRGSYRRRRHFLSVGLERHMAMINAVIDYFPTGSSSDTNGWRMWTASDGDTHGINIWSAHCSRGDAYRTLAQLIENGCVTGSVTERLEYSPLDPGWPFEPPLPPVM